MAELNEEQVEAVVEGIQAVARSFNTITVAAVAAASALSSFGVAYLAFNKRLKKKWTKIAEDEIDVMRVHYKAKTEAWRAQTQKPDLEAVITTLGYKEAVDGEVIAVKEAPPLEVVEEVQDAVVVAPHPRNVFEDAAAPAVDGWDYAAEVKSRHPGVPYIIHNDEFSANEKDYAQVHFVYFEDDDVLAGTDDEVIEDQDNIVNVVNLARFGHGSQDPNKVYVRNDVRELDIEIVRSNGSYAEEVHGLKHSDQPEHRQRRPEWDG